jgi:Tol biopolymer transport system component
MYRQAADGTGAPELLATSTNAQFPGSFSPDGSRLLLTDRKATDDIAMFSMDKRQLTALIPASAAPTNYAERSPEVSPDGKWLAYESWESTPPQIHVRPFPDVNSGKWQISKDGGTRPAWNPRGGELFFVGGSGANTALYSVPMPTTPDVAGNPVKLFNVQTMPGQLVSRFYDVSRDGQRFVVIKSPPTTDASGALARQQLVVVPNWIEELKAKVGGK